MNDVEFEALCKDVMEKKLSTNLRLFAKGRDGGIDLTNNAITHDFIIQVKHYIGSKFSNLRITLKNEINNVQKWKPKQYYVCCGMHLTDANISEIYNMFSEFMDSDKNIISLREIDEFLQKPENIDVVRKHYKLWLYASNILNEIFNQNIFIDCEALFNDIEEESKYFVQTEIYNQCLEHLDKNGLLMITGGPGVGKTTTSKMLVLYFSVQGYRVRYTTNGDMTDIKNSLSSDKDSKEIVLLDDCLGQHYFNMKNTQEGELLSLIKFVKLFKNKKIILNSRITIFNEAKDRSYEFKMFFQEKKIRNHTINMEDITPLEKAKIFYNHLIYKRIPKEYYEAIKRNKKYFKIVHHSNYTPRIIEHVTYRTNYLKVAPESYFDYIFESLSHPHDIWKNEFERRLKEVDRAFISTLYSLTDTTVQYSVLKECFDERLLKMKNVDYTINNYESILTRLNQSIINLVDNKRTMHVGVINPSVNDYMKTVFSDNMLELNEVRDSIKHFSQFERCYAKEDLPNIFFQLIASEEIFSIEFFSQDEKNYFIVANICQYEIRQQHYKQTIIDYLNNAYGYYYLPSSEWLPHIKTLEILLNDNLYSYYSLSSFISDECCINNLFMDLDLNELIATINLLSQCYRRNDIEVSWFKPLCKIAITNAIASQVENVDASEYCENYDIQDLVNENTKMYYYGDHEDMEIDRDAITQTLEKWVAEDIENEIIEKLSELDETISIHTDKLIKKNLSLDGFDSIIDSCFEPDYDYDEYHGSDGTGQEYISDIEAVFER
ncbi:restriction endonuclease [Alkaliphilus sp. B6464]|uniref:nSTAND3 domain-containing NTPase n=1 Tax=Alkaliphilus sp. B6464 TaxID=2731219 RepID=UPI001BA89B51|nr:restriction endonuclease [Alkaliphilus sp. B6464]QUH20385.1 restriction endonuclease [Alkaliphilus sp. B6464]